MSALRFDLVFSYWIYVWYVLYALSATKFSPKFPLILGLLDNIVMLVLMFAYCTSSRTIGYFIVINTLIKIVPLYYLRKEPIKLNDVYFTVLLFLIFVIWIHLNNQSLYGNMKLIHDSLIYGQDKTPFMDFINKIKFNFKNLEII
jgi:hypothetical protein